MSLAIGIVGLGHVAVHQIAALKRSDNFVIVAACDQNPDTRSLVDHSTTFFDDLDQMLNQANLDIVVVATPNKLHVEHGIQVISAGKWLVMEKPVAEKKSDYQRLADAKSRLASNCTLALHAAFGVELEWFYREFHHGQFAEWQFDSIECEFFDPYIIDGQLQSGAASLGGSWLDSGINALSVICRIVDPSSLTITSATMNSDNSVACTETSATVEFNVSDSRLSGVGRVNTSWTMGRNFKATTLGVANSDNVLVLDHTGQSVVLRTGDKTEILFSCENQLPRLTNHYIGVFDDLVTQVTSARDNFEYCSKLHDFLYEAKSRDS